MATTLHVQGADIELHEDETFNKARHRLNRALRQLEDYRQGNIDGDAEGQKFEPFHQLSFKMANGTAEGGRITVSVEKVIGVSSDEPKDVGGGE